jgi:hypothetical protein
VLAAYPAHQVSSIRPRQPNPTPLEGIDAGVTEVFTDTGGRRYGAGQYAKIAARSERDRARGKARNKLRAVRDRHLATGTSVSGAGRTFTVRLRAARSKGLCTTRRSMRPASSVTGPPTRASPAIPPNMRSSGS